MLNIGRGWQVLLIGALFFCLTISFLLPLSFEGQDGGDNVVELKRHEVLSQTAVSLPAPLTSLNKGDIRLSIKFNQGYLREFLYSRGKLESAFIENLKQAGQGKGSSALLAWSILDHCLRPFDGYSGTMMDIWRSKVKEKNMPQGLKEEYISELARCDNIDFLAAQKGVDPDELLLRAADLGQPMAQALAAANCSGLNLRADMCLKYFDQSARYLPDEALAAMQVISATAGESLVGSPNDQAVYYAGLKLAACKLGADCSPASFIMYGVCGNQCSRFAGVEEALRMTTDNNTYELAQDYSDHLVALFLQHKYEAPEFKQIERIIKQQEKLGG